MCTLPQCAGLETDRLPDEVMSLARKVSLLTAIFTLAPRRQPSGPHRCLTLLTSIFAQYATHGTALEGAVQCVVFARVQRREKIRVAV